MGTLPLSSNQPFTCSSRGASGLESNLDGSSPFPDEVSTSPVSYLQSDKQERGHTMPFIILSDDELIARLLIHTWTLTTGKTLRGDVPPDELTEEELIDFWSDDSFD